MERRLAAILAADVVGYSRLMGADEAGTLEALKAVRKELVAPEIAGHRGRVVKLMGDGLLAEFGSVVDAVECGVAIQTSMRARGDGVPEARRIRLRIGINLGDVMIDGRDIYGDGVNVAARLEGLAEPGGICVSATVREHVAGKLNHSFVDDGEHTVKNIAHPVHVWRWADGAGPAARAAAADVLALPDKPSIVVLPFDNMSGDPEQEYVADGVVEALTAALSRIRAFFVIARNSAFAYKGRAVDMREIRRDLGVAYVLEGSVQRAGGRLRITVQLIETETGAHIWAERYDGSLDDIFDLQDRITEQVAGALQPSIRLAEIERARRKRPDDLGAYGYTMRAMRHVWMLEKDEAAKALSLLEKALRIDPDYPLALALAAWCHAQRSVYNWVADVGAARAEALALAERATDLAAKDPLVLTVMGTVHTLTRNYGSARVLLERAVALDPNAAWAWSRLGWLATYTERPEEAQTYFEKALRLSPVDPMNFNNHVGIASALQVAGEEDQAADMFLHALDEQPHALWIHRNLAAVLWGAGREAEARESFRIMIDAYPGITIKQCRDALVFSPGVVDRICEQLEELGLPPE